MNQKRQYTTPDWMTAREFARHNGISETYARNILREALADGRAKRKTVKGDPYLTGHQMKRPTKILWKITND